MPASECSPAPLHTTVSPYQSVSGIPFYRHPTATQSGIVGHNSPEARRDIAQLFKSQGFKEDRPTSKGFSESPEALLFQPGLRRPARCHRRCAGASWHVLLSHLLVLHKGAGAIATTQTILYKGFQEDTGLGPGPSRPTPGARPQSSQRHSSAANASICPGPASLAATLASAPRSRL